jgi:hypothetical protein
VVVCLPTVRSAYFTGSCSVVKLHTCRGRREGALLRRGAKLEVPRPRTAATGVQVLHRHGHKVGWDRHEVKLGLYTLPAVLAVLGCWQGSACAAAALYGPVADLQGAIGQERQACPLSTSSAGLMARRNPGSKRVMMPFSETAASKPSASGPAPDTTTRQPEA